MRPSVALMTAARITPLTVPTNQVPPSISPAPVEGTTLTANPGLWVGNPPVFPVDGVHTTGTIVWQQATSQFGSFSFLYGSSATYTPVAGDVGHWLHVVVTYTTSSGTGSATSPAVGPVALAAPPSPPTPPTIQ